MIVTMLLLCLQEPPSVQSTGLDRQAPSAPTESKDLSDFLGLLLAADLGGGLDAHHQPSLFGGLKIGVPVGVKGGNPPTVLRTVTLDVGYDRIQSRPGFSGELSMMLPIARFPTPYTPGATYARVYFEPGGGYRGGGGNFGMYASAKAMLVLFSNDRLTRNDAPPSFFLEIQRRVPLSAPVHGDTRLVIGLMTAICNHCGLN